MKLTKYDPFDIHSFWNWPTVFEDADIIDNKGLDVYETENKVVIKTSVAGLEPDKVDVTFEKGILWIRGEQTQQEKDGRKYYKKSSRSYSYKVAVPGNVDLKEDPNAEIKNGVLKVVFNKTEEDKPKKITIKTR